MEWSCESKPVQGLLALAIGASASVNDVIGNDGSQAAFGSPKYHLPPQRPMIEHVFLE